MSRAGIVAIPFMVCLWLPAAAIAWPEAVHETVVSLALKVAPPALRGQLERHHEALVAGALAPDRRSSATEHRLHFDGSGGSLANDTVRVAQEAIELVRTRGSFAELASKLGELSHLIADAAYPLNTSDTDSREPLYAADYAAYSQRKLARFPPLFKGYEVIEAGGLEAYVRAVAERANRNYAAIGAAYFPTPDSPMRRSSTFDDRGPAFGVTQLSFVDAVTATANAWLFVWREAHGDLTGTPHTTRATR